MKTTASTNDGPDEEEGYTGECWCGATDGWFSEAGLEETCGDSGVLNCFCGGDLCVCHNHGEVECPGCEECGGDDEAWDDYDGEW